MMAGRQRLLINLENVEVNCTVYDIQINYFMAIFADLSCHDLAARYAHAAIYITGPVQLGISISLNIISTLNNVLQP